MESHHTSPVALGALEVLHSAMRVGGRLLALSAPLAGDTTSNHWFLNTEVAEARLVEAGQVKPVLLDRVEPVLGLCHQGGVRDRVPNI